MSDRLQKIDRLARQLVAQKGLTLSAANAEVLRLHPELHWGFDREGSVRSSRLAIEQSKQEVLDAPEESSSHTEVIVMDQRDSLSKITNEIDAAAKDLQRRERLSYHQAYARVLADNPTLYERYKSAKMGDFAR